MIKSLKMVNQIKLFGDPLIDFTNRSVHEAYFPLSLNFLIVSRRHFLFYVYFYIMPSEMVTSKGSKPFSIQANGRGALYVRTVTDLLEVIVRLLKLDHSKYMIITIERSYLL